MIVVKRQKGVNKLTHKFSSSVNMIIEKDGVVYTASLRTVARAQSELRELGVSEEDAQKDLDKLMRLRARIIEAYCNNYQNDPTLPSKPRKDVKAVNLRISNGQINNQKENNLPQYRKLTEVEDLQIPSDPYELTDALESGEIEIGYGSTGNPVYIKFGYCIH